ncbi:hypothetical protein DAPPUDRAFT_249728 [Daphnia pulex]|uniref:SAM domain-containing protein n=1 Tax=Daphnia pulex TaxID=6669 RepID=E9GX67_DAPPU|nr:hypothetical protein DAPPUDRAFT_249728 [Daphnia pulex]|eukprot:EFX75917.1 hypothetical protein DAPPUDRAFT_249728 [Daphnia pulex]
MRFRKEFSFPNCPPRREDIDGECLMSLSEKQIEALKLSIGHAAKLQKLVNSFNIENINAQPPNLIGSQKPVDSIGNDLQDDPMLLVESNQNILIVTSGQEKVPFEIFSILKESSEMKDSTEDNKFLLGAE